MTARVLSPDAHVSPAPRDLPVLRGVPLIVMIVALAAANFMSFLDITIANVALPHIAGALGVTAHEGVWTITSYAVAEAITVPLTGWVTARFGTLRVFIVAAVSFGVFSLICGLAGALEMLVAARILQGLAGGFLIPVSQVLLQAIVEPKRANIAIAVWGATALTAPVFGPVLGGLFCDSVGWEWCFFVNVPIAALCAFVPWLMLRRHETPLVKSKVDYVGLGFLIIWVGAFQIMIDTGEQHDWFGAASVRMLAVIAFLGLAAFVIWELGEKSPIVNLRIFRHIGFLIPTGVVFVSFGAMSAFNVIAVLWLQTGMGYTATWSGYAMAFIAGLSTFMAPLVGFLMSRLDPRLLISGGLAVVSASMVCRLGYAANITFEGVIPAQIAMGIGGTFFFLPIMGMAMASVERAEIASAAGLFNFARTLSIAFGSAVGIALWNRSTGADHARLAGALNDPALVMKAAPALGLSPLQARSLIDGMVQSESVMLATNHMFLVLGLACGVGALLIWLAPKPAAPLEALPLH